MINILPLGPQYSNRQRAAPIQSVLGRGGNKKERVLLTLTGTPLQDNCKLEKMRYAVAGKIISKEEALKQTKKKGWQKNVVIVVNSPQKDSQKIEQQFVLVNQASFAKRHGLSLMKVHQAAKKSNKELFKELSKDTSSSVIHQNNDFTRLAAERIKAIATGQSIVKEACLKLRALHNGSKKKAAIDEYLQTAEQIPDKLLKKRFQKMLQNGQDLKKLDKVLNKFQNTLGWEDKDYENPLASLFENSKEIEFRSAVWDIFQQSKPIAGQGEIVISGYVMPDGKGDYVHMQNMAKKLHKQFPERKIRLIVIGAEIHKDKLPLLDQSVCTTNLTFSGDGSPRFEESPFDKDMSPLIQNADLWISGPVGISGLFDHLHQEAQTKGIAFTEYDTDTNLAAGSFGSKIKLGLKHAGVFTQKAREGSWKRVQNETLKTTLFGSTQPKKEAIADYLASHQLLMCYQSNPTFFFDQAVQFSTLSDPGKSIDICFPSKNEIKTPEDVETLIHKNRLKELGVGSVKWIAADENGRQKEINIPIQENGKELRIINPGMLTKKDFKLITLLSAPLVGCTGDHSLTQALSYGKIPAYEIVGHKRALAQNLYNLSVKKFGEEAALSKYITACLTKKLEDFDPKDLISQGRELGESIRENFSFNKHLKGMVNARLCEAKDSEFAAFEAQLKKNYLNGTITLEDLKKQMREELVRKGIL